MDEIVNCHRANGFGLSNFILILLCHNSEQEHLYENDMNLYLTRLGILDYSLSLFSHSTIPFQKKHDDLL